MYISTVVALSELPVVNLNAFPVLPFGIAMPVSCVTVSPPPVEKLLGFVFPLKYNRNTFAPLSYSA